jgi:hypothetical protein
MASSIKMTLKTAGPKSNNPPLVTIDDPPQNQPEQPSLPPLAPPYKANTCIMLPIWRTPPGFSDDTPLLVTANGVPTAFIGGIKAAKGKMPVFIGKIN